MQLRNSESTSNLCKSTRLTEQGLRNTIKRSTTLHRQSSLQLLKEVAIEKMKHDWEETELRKSRKTKINNINDFKNELQEHYEIELTEEDITKCNRVFDKIFGNSFHGYQHKLQKMLHDSNFKEKTLNEVINEISYINYTMIEHIKKGTGPFKEEEQHYKKNKVNNHSQIQYQSQFESKIIYQPQLSPQQKLKYEQLRSLMRMKPQDYQEEVQAAQQLIKKLKKEKQKREQKLKIKLIEIEQLEKAEIEDFMKKKIAEEEKKKQEIEKRREEIKSKLDYMKIERERKKFQWEENMRNEKENRYHNKPLYKQLEQKFNEELEMKEYYKRKNALEQIRSLKRPIHREELEEHAKKYEDILEEKFKKKQQERVEKQKQDEHNFDPDRFKTKVYQEVEQQLMQQKEEKEIKEEMKKLLIDKKENYARYIREMHLPKRSKNKEKELQELISSLHHPVRKPIKYPPGSNIDGMKRSKSFSKSRLDETEKSKIGGRNTMSEGEERISPVDKAKIRISVYNRSNRPPLPLPVSHLNQESKRTIKTDYLKERRKRRELLQVEEKQRDWTFHLTNNKLSQKEKFYRIKEKARELEEMALRKEQILNVKSNGELFNTRSNAQSVIAVPNGRNDKNIEETLEVNEMLVDAIKAKLAILDNINSNFKTM